MCKTACQGMYKTSFMTYEAYFDMTGWILVENGIIFPWRRALVGYISPVSSNLVHNEDARVSPWSPCQYLVLLWWIPPGVHLCPKQHCSYLLSSQICSGRILLTGFKPADNKGVKQRVTSTAFLDDGYRDATIPFVNGHHVTWQWE